MSRGGGGPCQSPTFAQQNFHIYITLEITKFLDLYEYIVRYYEQNQHSVTRLCFRPQVQRW
jgi:hypothetical protein